MRLKTLSRLILTGIALCLGLFAILAPSLDMVGLEAFSVGQVLLLFIALILLVFGIWDEQTAGPRVKQVYQVVALMLLNTFVLLMLIEGVAIIGFNAFVRSLPEGQLIAEAPNLPYYQEVPWGEQYWREFKQVGREVYQPFTVWRRAEFHGETMNVDANGIRLTPGAVCTEEAYTIYIFGGSTMWGYGAPDEMTIPAHIQAGLSQAREQDVCVINMAEWGYMSTQELIRLMLELQKGHVPDLAIFYDGQNDIFAAYQAGYVGGHQNIKSIEAPFNHQLEHPLVRWLRDSYTMRLLSVFIVAPPHSTQLQLSNEELIEGIIANYNGNRQLVAALSEAYGFDYMFVWHPLIASALKPLAGEESKIIIAHDPKLLELYRAVYTGIASIQDEHFYNLTNALDQETGQIWFDSSHILPPANQVIANRILQIIAAQE